ncbi:MAG TPA: DUF2274 domain-containing protein [Terriglobia bacterium]|nr:DUF2274 domain-containing protein [Terriglobia bacterium]
MTELKLNRLPDRMPVKITVTVQPDLNKALLLYAELYRESYGDEESVTDLIPYMLQSFLDADRNFVKAFRERAANGELPNATDTRKRSGRRRLSPIDNPSTSN